MFYQCDNCQLYFLHSELEKLFFICGQCTTGYFTPAHFYECHQCSSIYILNDKNLNRECKVCLSKISLVKERISLHCINCNSHINLNTAFKRGLVNPIRCLNLKCNGIAQKRTLKLNKRLDLMETIIDEPQEPIDDQKTLEKSKGFLSMVVNQTNGIADLPKVELNCTPSCCVGRSMIEQLFKQNFEQSSPEWFSLIKTITSDANKQAITEQFIIEQRTQTEFYIKDRNNPSTTFLNNQLLGDKFTALHNGDKIIVPVLVEGEKRSLILAFSVETT
jgi:DNA-directed RNA polymerase subunit RPC12/RpoP